jgi:hypothetical protein
MSTGLTSRYSFPYPLSTDPVNVSGDIEDLAEKIDADLQEIIEDKSSLMWTTGGTFSNGLLAPTYNDTTGKMSMSLSQDLQTSASPTFAAITISGNAAINGGEITTSATTATVFNATATTLNIGQAATTISIGATTGTITLRNPTVVSAATSLTLFNTASTTINFGGAATTFNIGASTGAATMNLSNGATTNGTTKTVNIGGSGVNGSITNINLGSSVSGALGTLTINSPTVSIPSTAISLGTITSGIWNGTEIAVNRGGTGLASYTVGDIVYASASTTLAKLGIGSNNHVLTSNGSAPVWTTNTGTGNVVRADSPALSGIPTAPTASVDTSTTQIATTAYVVNQNYIKANQLITISGDATGSGTTAISLTLANTAVSPASYGSASAVGTFTVDSKGRLTAAANTNIALSASAITSGILAIARGGTNLATTPANGQLLIGNGTDYTLATLTAGENISITNSAGSITINSTGGGGGSASPEDVIGITFFTMGA